MWESRGKYPTAARGRMKYGKAAGRSGRKVYGCKRMGAETLVAFRQMQDPQPGILWDPFCGEIKKKNSGRSFFIFHDPLPEWIIQRQNGDLMRSDRLRVLSLPLARAGMNRI